MELNRKGLHRVLFWMALSLVVLGFAFLLDKPVKNVFTLGSTNHWRPLAVYLSKAGEGWVIGVAGVMASLVLFWGQRFRASRMAVLITTAGLLTGASATVLRSLIGRTRPDAHEAQGFYGVWHGSHWIIGKYEFGAFPSGHAATVFGLAAAAWLINRRLGTAALFYAGLVTWSRIALGCHHFSDTVAAAVLGVFGAYVVVAKLPPLICCLGPQLFNGWLSRKRSISSSNPGRV